MIHFGTHFDFNLFQTNPPHSVIAVDSPTIILSDFVPLKNDAKLLKLIFLSESLIILKRRTENIHTKINERNNNEVYHFDLACSGFSTKLKTINDTIYILD